MLRLVQTPAVVGALVLAACPAPTAPAQSAANEQNPELVVFAADTDDKRNPGLGDVAVALNAALKGRFPDGPKTRTSPVNAVDARAVVEECNVPSAPPERCFAALAQLNHALKVLVPELAAERRHAVSATLTLYDASAQKVLRSAQRSWKNAEEARGGVASLVDEVAAPGSGG
jgi:hypothetical protein